MGRAEGLDDVQVVVGGIIPDQDVPALNALGIEGVFRPGSSMAEIVRFIETHVGRDEGPGAEVSRWPGR